MRELTRFTPREWLQLTPLAHLLKETRNDLVLAKYLRQDVAELEAFIATHRHLRDKKLIAIIAFEQPLALYWMLSLARRFLVDCHILVFDNSRTSELRTEIREMCTKLGVSYLALPFNLTRHANRSHGLAINWAYQRVIKALEPEIFGFVDHDMLPGTRIDIGERLGQQPCFGALNKGKGCWNLWAGYCFFRFSTVAGIDLNFLYDFSRGLDTGGRNWPGYFSKIDRERMRFAPREYSTLIDPDSGDQRSVQIVDERWLHIGSISYNNNFDAKKKFFADLFAAMNDGTDWRSWRVSQ